MPFDDIIIMTLAKACKQTIVGRYHFVDKLFVVQEIFYGNRDIMEYKQTPWGIYSYDVSQRLDNLVAHILIERITYSSPICVNVWGKDSREVYQLSADSREIIPEIKGDFPDEYKKLTRLLKMLEPQKMFNDYNLLSIAVNAYWQSKYNNVTLWGYLSDKRFKPVPVEDKQKIPYFLELLEVIRKEINL